MATRERVAKAVIECIKHSRTFELSTEITDAVYAIFAEERAALVELKHIDEVLARRPALADCKTRIDKIELAIGAAKRLDQTLDTLTKAEVRADGEREQVRQWVDRCEKAEAREAALREALEEAEQALTWAQYSGRRKCGYCNKRDTDSHAKGCWIHDTIERVRAALAKEEKP